MADVTYTFSISQDFPNGKVAIDKLEEEIRSSTIVTALSHINTINDTCEIIFKAELSPEDEIVLNEVISQHDGEPLVSYDQIEVINRVKLDATNLSGKVEVHESSRVAGTTTQFTGAGDDPSDITDVGNGELFMLKHRIGDPLTQYLYLDFNIVENPTWIHEGYIIWKDAAFDLISFEIAPIVPQYIVSSGTNYKLYNNYLIIPANGDGNIEIQSDLSNPRGGLVFMPSDEVGNKSPGFWNADWNSNSKKYENITPAPYGNGDFNIFAFEVSLNRFVNKQIMIGDGFQRMRTADADRLGQGMRLRITGVTHEPDHDWFAGCVLTLYRERTA